MHPHVLMSWAKLVQVFAEYTDWRLVVGASCPHLPEDEIMEFPTDTQYCAQLLSDGCIITVGCVHNANATHHSPAVCSIKFRSNRATNFLHV